jgi:serine/alanine adding enzyme
VNISVVRDLPEDVWRSFVEDHPLGNVFHTPEMYKVFSNAKGYRPELWAAVDEGGSPLAMLLPVQISLFDGLLRQLTTRAVAYGSILWSPSDAGLQAITYLLRKYAQNSDGAPLFTELRNLSDLAQVQPALRDCGFVYEEHLNYLIDLGCSPEGVFQNLRPRTRKNIRHVLNQGKVAIEELDRREKIGPWYKVLRQTYQVARVPLADLSLFEAAFDVLIPKGMIRFTQARAAEAVIATSVELLYKDTIFGWYGGVDRAYGIYNANEFLTWHILDWGARQGYRQYDFGGAGKPNEKYGVRDFKAKFGGRLVCYGRNTCIHRPGLLSISQQGYKLLRGVVSR